MNTYLAELHLYEGFVYFSDATSYRTAATRHLCGATLGSGAAVARRLCSTRAAGAVRDHILTLHRSPARRVDVRGHPELLMAPRCLASRLHGAVALYMMSGAAPLMLAVPGIQMTATYASTQVRIILDVVRSWNAVLPFAWNDVVRREGHNCPSRRNYIILYRRQGRELHHPGALLGLLAAHERPRTSPCAHPDCRCAHT